MVAGFLGRLRAGLGLADEFAAGAGALPKNKLRLFLSPFDKAGGSIAGAVLRYVAHGDNSSILATLQAPAIRQAWNGRVRMWPRQDGAGLFADLGLWRIDQMRRLGEALAVLEPISHDWGYFGTAKSPDWLRHVVTLWLSQDWQDQPLDTLLDLTAEDGGGVEAALDILFSRDPAVYRSTSSVGRFAGVERWLAEAQGAIATVVPVLAADVRAELATTLGRLALQDGYLDLLLDLATGSSKKVRTSARQALTTATSNLLKERLAARFATAPPGRRAELAEVAGESLGPRGPALLARWRDGEKVAKVLAALDRVSGALRAPPASAAPLALDEQRDGPEGYRAVDGSWIAAGAPVELPAPAPLPAKLLRSLEPAVAAFNAALAAAKATADPGRWHWSRPLQPVVRRDLEALAALAGGAERLEMRASTKALDWLRCRNFTHPAVDAFFHDPRLSLRHLARLAAALTNGHLRGLFTDDWAGPVGVAVRQRTGDAAGLRAFYHCWVEIGGSDVVVDHLQRHWHWPLPELEAPLWPLLCDRFDVLDQALGLAPQAGAEHKLPLPALDLLSRFPLLPERYRSRLMLLATDNGRRLRERARTLLAATPAIDATIALQLQDGRQDVRAQTAEWLAARGAKGEEPRLRAALAKERSDLARAAMITALERLGADVSEYFAPDTLLAQARAGLAKPRPKGLDWFPFDALPALRWADGQTVDPQLLEWWVVLAARLRQPGGNALLNLWLDRLAPGHAHWLGWLVLTGWIEQDTRRPSDEEANAYAAAHVDATVRQHADIIRRYPESAGYLSTDHAVVFAKLKQLKTAEYLGSAVESKGVLALAARVGGAEAAQRIRPFLKEHGARTAQAKALLDVLAAIGDAAALQQLLAAANRSKQKTVQAHAAVLVEAIAERNGWTPAQLADRTVPTGGFDADGLQDLELGEGRIYRLCLDDDAQILLHNPDGRAVQALPASRGTDDKPAEAARKQLSAARKEVRQVVAAQVARLQEAMLLQRGWDADEWERFIAGHPIVGRLAARLVWQGYGPEGKPLASFRPLGDGSCTDARDNAVDPASFAQVRLAHRTTIGPAESDAWTAHLADYAVAAPFLQFGPGPPDLSEEQLGERALGDRAGWMIETFQLRGIATRLGYQRGPAQDGGWFTTYEKTYREAGLVAEIAFSGNGLPEENRRAALHALAFRRLAGGGAGGGAVMLREVPPVLLAASRQDLHDMADKGSGFEPDWQNKVNW